MYRAKDSLLPIQYYNKLPKNQTCDVAYVMDPSIATSNTIIAVVSMLKRWGAKRIIVVSTSFIVEWLSFLIAMPLSIFFFHIAAVGRYWHSSRIVQVARDAPNYQCLRWSHGRATIS